jgi:hypothetical protein
MYQIHFCDTKSEPFNTSGITVDCKRFTETLKGCPSDRHNYYLRVYKNPIRIGRLPLMAKNFLKYIRYYNHFQLF